MSMGVIASGARASRYRDAVLALNPLAYYRLGDPMGGTLSTPMLDETANHRDGILANNPTLVSGLLVGDGNGARSLNGTSHSGQVTTPSWLDVGSNFSITGLLKTSATGFREICARFSSLTSRTFELRIDSTTGALNFIRVINSGAATSVIGVTNIRTGVPIHFGMTYNGVAVKLYINNVLDKTGACAGSLNAVTSNPKLGIGERNSDQYFNGVLDEIAFYGTVLTQAEITNLYTISGV